MRNDASLFRAPEIRLLIAGREHRDWLRYSVENDLAVPAGAFSLTLSAAAGPLPASLRPWAEVALFVDGTRVLAGRIDGLRRSAARDGCFLEIHGRDNAAALLDCSAPVFVGRRMSLKDVAATLAGPFGLACADILGRGPHEKITVEPGMTAWDALQRAAEANGVFVRFTPGGALRLGTWDFGAPPVAELRCMPGESAAASNVLSLCVEESAEQRWSEVTVLGQAQGAEDRDGENTVRAVVRDPAFPAARSKIHDAGHVETAAQAMRIAQGIMEEGVRSSLRVTATTAGHYAAPGVLWEPGQRVRVRSAVHGLDQVLLLAQRAFTGSEKGFFTSLVLRPDCGSL